MADSQVARVATIAAAKSPWRVFEQQDRGARFARGNGCAETSIAAADDEDVDVRGLSRRAIFEGVEIGMGSHRRLIAQHRS